MSICMDLSPFSTSVLISGTSLCPFASQCVFYNSIFDYKRFGQKVRSSSVPSRRISARVGNGFSSLSENQTPGDVGSFSGEEFVEVICLGSRKDAIADFCLDSPFQTASLRFWNILMKDSMDVQLQEKILSKDITPKILDPTLFGLSSSKSIIVVASAGFGLEYIALIDTLKKLRSTNGFSVAIALRPFSFEGQRRLDEVQDLIGRLREHATVCIDVDMDMLLKKDLVTLDEALKTANKAVLLAINAIYALISEKPKKFSVVKDSSMKELKVSEVVKIMENYKEAKVGFGAGHNVKTSMLQAIYDCPFIGNGVKEWNGMVICILASSAPINNSDVQAFLRTFRQTTEYKRDIIISMIYEPSLESDMIVTTVIILSCLEEELSQKGSIFFRLAQNFLFLFDNWRTYQPQANVDKGINVIKKELKSEMKSSSQSSEVESTTATESNSQDSYNFSEELEGDNSYNEVYGSSKPERGEIGLVRNMTESITWNDQVSEGTSAFQSEPIISWNLGPGYQIAQQWAEKRASNSVNTPIIDSLSIFSLPVGVRPSEQLKDDASISARHQEQMTADEAKAQSLTKSSKPVRDFYDTASTLLRGKSADISPKQGNLSSRAAFMLEAERDPPQKWNPILEMHYRGGVYKGRCQGGLPEGKGRLVLEDGSIYDGMWRFGKRSGPGTFYFSNGDVFQGTWRDDVMHGKGWFYFHTGDRWFANFWKGKANGEGRFYSKSGDVFFGHFRDGWRHGRFLSIHVDGERCFEIWDEGVLVSREESDPDATPEQT